MKQLKEKEYEEYQQYQYNEICHSEFEKKRNRAAERFPV